MSCGRRSASSSPPRCSMRWRCSGAPRRAPSRSASATATTCSSSPPHTRSATSSGVEVHRSGVGRVLLALQSRQLRNVRLVCHDAVEVLEQQIPAGSVDEILILFPDPWPKKRHHKRRLIQAPFATLAASRLAPGGRAANCHRLAAVRAGDARDAAGGPAASEPCQRRGLRAATARARTHPLRAPRRALGHEVWDLAFRRT